MIDGEDSGAAAPDLSDVFLALDTIGSALSTGMRQRQPSFELLQRLRSVDIAAAAPSRAAPPAPSPRAPIAASETAPETAAGDSAQTAAPAYAGTLADLQIRAQSCVRCVLSSARKHVVFGQGVANPAILVIGEGPGAEEDNQGLPFVGASGHLLDKMLSSIGLSREENCYIANVVKCRPPNNREPAPDERAACMPYLREQIRLLSPKAILCAGRTAAQALLSTTEGINRLRNRMHEYEGIPVVATFHPSALLRDPTLKRPAWEDLKRLRDLIPPPRSRRP
ncbi:MAG TPA: uracil-DNA glycosylase [Rectinemataceae bacterium]|nr:uracil-DNA glycosylase [Rectinemataceae bacterium]